MRAEDLRSRAVTIRRWQVAAPTKTARRRKPTVGVRVGAVWPSESQKVGRRREAAEGLELEVAEQALKAFGAEEDSEGRAHALVHRVAGDVGASRALRPRAEGDVERMGQEHAREHGIERRRGVLWTLVQGPERARALAELDVELPHGLGPTQAQRSAVDDQV